MRRQIYLFNLSFCDSRIRIDEAVQTDEKV